MATTVLPETIETEINALVRGGYFRSRGSFIEDAVKYTLISRQDLRVNAAIEMYRSGRVSLGRATELAGMSIFEFKEILKERGIKMVVEAPTKEEMDRQIERLEEDR
ncbi:MAG: UPF0175 family protein, partial [Euryarchaeota archaeon]|nr:UPF0175 family protein [Euryarchaeota archaeon]